MRPGDAPAGMTDGEPDDDADDGGRLSNAAEFVVDVGEFVLDLF